MAFFSGTSSDDTQTGTGGDDNFDYSQGGNDALSGLDGTDFFYMGTALNAGDSIDGGIGVDTVSIDAGSFLVGGDREPISSGGAHYTVTFGANTMTNVETLLLSGTSFKLTSHDNTVAAGATLHVDATVLFGAFGEHVHFDGSAETDGNFFLDGGEGNDELIGGAGQDTIYGSNGNDRASGGDGDDYIDGGGGKDVLAGGLGHNQLYGGDGNDQISTLGLTGTFDGGEGSDTIHADAGGGYLVQGGDGHDDVFFSGHIGSDYIILGNNGTDTLHLNGFADIETTSWSPFLAGFEVLVLELGSGPIDVRALNGANTIISFANLEASTNGAYLNIIGGLGDDTLTGSDLDDTITDDTGNNTLYGGKGNDTLSVLNSTGLNELHGGSGNDALTAGSGGGLFYGGAGGDDITGGTGGTDNLYGGAANDEIHANQGATDFVYAGMGDDSVFFAGTISQQGQISGDSGTDTLTLTGTVHVAVSEFDPANMGFEFLAIGMGGGTIIDDDAGNTTIDLSNTPISFNDGTFHIIGGGGGDTLIGSKLNDTIEDSSGNNTLVGGKGADSLTATGGGSNALYGGKGKDTLTGDPAGSTLDGGAGDDTIHLLSTIDSGTVLFGGAGYDTLEFGDDVHLLVSSFAPAALFFEELLLTPGGGTVSVLDEDGTDSFIDFSNIHASTNGAAFRIVGSTGNDTIVGSNLDDTIEDTVGSNILDGRDGDDTLDVSGGGIVNTLYGGDGADELLAGSSAGGNVLYGGDGDDDLDTTSSTGGNNLIGNDGNDTLHGDGATASQFFDGGDGDDKAYGGLSGDTMVAGPGTDTLKGNNGDDSLNLGADLDAADKIDGGANIDTLYLNGDYNGPQAVVFGADTLKNVERISFAAFHSYDITSHNKTVAGGALLWVDGGGLFSGDSLTFDGSAETNGSFQIDGGEGGDHLTGGANADLIYGGKGADHIVAIAGGDTVDGGEGNDHVHFAGEITSLNQVQGGEGHGDELLLDEQVFVNTSSFAPGNNGFELVHLLNDGVVISGNGNPNTISFASVVVSADNIGAALIIEGNGGDDDLTGSNWHDLLNGGAGNNNLTGLAGDDVLDVTGSSGSNTLDGGAGNDDLTAGAGTDSLYGGADDDTLTSGGGHAALYGGSGDDQMYAGSGDTADGGSGKDQVFFAGDIGTDNQVLGGGGKDTLSLSGTIGVNVASFAPALLGFEKVVLVGPVTLDGDAGNNAIDFSGVVVSLGVPGRAVFAAGDFVINGGDGDDDIIGSNLGETIHGGAGNNALAGLGGDDVISVEGTAGSNALDGGDGDDILNSSFSSGFNSLFGGDGDDKLNNAGSTVFGVDLYGGAGDDKFIGGEERDDFYGGTGNETIAGNGGDDVSRMFADFDQNDRIDGGAGFDSLYLDGDYNGANAISLLPATLKDVEFIVLADGHDYEITTHDGVVAAGADLAISAGNLTSDFSLHFDGSAETDGSFIVFGGDGGDFIVGGDGDDHFYGGDGNDQIFALSGGDSIIDGGFGDDQVSFAGTVSPSLFRDDGGTDQLILDLPVFVNTTFFRPSTNGGLGSFELVRLLNDGVTITGNVNSNTIDFSGLTVSADQADANLIIEGDVGFDTLTGSNWHDTLYGGVGDDTLYGGDGNDDLFGGGGVDDMHGGAGKDNFVAGTGDSVEGGDDNDTVSFTGIIASNDQLTGDAGNDKLILEGAIEVHTAVFDPAGNGFETIELIVPVTITGDGSDNTIDFSGVMVTEIEAARGLFHEGAFTIDGGGGDDTITGSNIGETIFGGAGNNALSGLGGDDILDVQASSGTNTLDGGDGRDTLNAGSGNDTLNGGIGADLLVGGLGHAAMFGGNGADEIRADLGGIYTVDAGGGADTVAFKGIINQDNQILGGTGADTLVLAGNVTLRVPVFNLLALGFETLGANGNPVTIAGGVGANSIDLAGVAIADTLPALTINGGGGDDTIRGTTGGDTILGGLGNDSLRGAEGDDALNGGAGIDDLDGGTGADAFVFTSTSDSGASAGQRDTVAFNKPEGDVIDLHIIDADTTHAANQAFDFVEGGNFSGTAGELVAVVISGHTVVLGDVNGDGLADFGIQLTTATVVDAADFVL